MAQTSALDEEIAVLTRQTKAVFASDRTLPIAWRLKQLHGIKALVTENNEAIVAALQKDLGVNKFWAKGVEVGLVAEEAHTAIKNLKSWMKPEYVDGPLAAFPSTCYTQREPLGTVLIIAPWNYPVTLLLNPLIGAIAAGNTAVLKPSELSVHTSALLAQLIPKYVDNEAVRVVEGAIPESTALLKQKWDLIFYTGSTMVGRIVHQAAAKHLTPVVLELGGKCPAIVSDDANVKKTAERIAWGKFTLNMGQTCLSPDYVLCSAAMRPKLIEALKTAIKTFFSSTPRESKDVSRIINQRHAARIADLLDDPTIHVEHGGEVDVEARYIAPTVVTATEDSKCMQSEIFGPVLPVVVVDDVHQAVQFVRERPKPLGLYVFTEKSKVSKYVLGHTSSGSAIVNDCSLAAGCCNLPFGGVGASGTGSYHSIHGFRAFSHTKAVIVKHGNDLPVRFAPFTPFKENLLIKLMVVDVGLIKKGVGLLALAGLAAVGYYSGAFSQFLN